jgi:antibiotic biosynthesis monooxygenase (ABM) superfamily enzyme
MTLKKLLLSCFLISFLAGGVTPLLASHHGGGDAAKPSTVIHVVTVTWKADATEAQIQAALDGVHTLAKAYPGITRAWTKTIKAQGERTHAFVMEFKDEQALKDYAGSAEQKAWYEVYIPVRGRSTTFDITN